jgi:hypothetical protein
VKAVLQAITRCLSVEAGAARIRVNAVSPRPLKTRAASRIAAFDELVADAVGRSPAGRSVDMAEVGRAVAFLVDGGASGTTGDTIDVDAGLHDMAGTRGARRVAALPRSGLARRTAPGAKSRAQEIMQTHLDAIGRTVAHALRIPDKAVSMVSRAFGPCRGMSR